MTMNVNYVAVCRHFHYPESKVNIFNILLFINLIYKIYFTHILLDMI